MIGACSIGVSLESHGAMASADVILGGSVDQ